MGYRFALRFPLYAVAVCAFWLPFRLAWGPLDSESQSAEYLRTVWQVVAARCCGGSHRLQRAIVSPEGPFALLRLVEAVGKTG